MKKLLITMMNLNNAIVALETERADYYTDSHTTKEHFAYINEQLEPLIKAVDFAEFEAKLVFNQLVQDYLDEQAKIHCND